MLPRQFSVWLSYSSLLFPRLIGGCARLIAATLPSAAAKSRDGLAKSNAGDFVGAISDYDEAIRLNPKFAIAFNNRASSKHGLQDFTGAIEDYNEAIRLDPKFAIAYNNRASSKHSLQEFAEAIKDFDEAIRLNRLNAATYYNRGASRHGLQDFVGAIKDFDEAIRRYPNFANAYHNRGWSKQSLHDYRGAINDYNAAIRLVPESFTSRNNLAFLYATATDEVFRDANKALAEAESLLTADPNNAYAMSAKACALALAGNFTDAISLQRRAIEDTVYAKDGGKHFAARIAAWEKGEPWLQP